MRDETLLDKANLDYNTAIMIYNQMDGDERYLNNVGYFLSQAVEKGIKHLLIKNGVEYHKTHDIDQLIGLGKENGADLLTNGYIENHSEMFTLWEVKTRYVLNYRLEKWKIDQAIDEIPKFLDRIEQRENEISDEKDVNDERSEEGVDPEEYSEDEFKL